MVVSAYHVVSEEVESHIFRPTCMYKQPTLTKQWNYNIFVQILYSYFRYTGMPFLGCVLFVARCNIIKASWETNNESLSLHRRTCVRNITFLTASHSFYVVFCYFLRLLPPPFQVTYKLNGPYKDTYYCYSDVFDGGVGGWRPPSSPRKVKH